MSTKESCKNGQWGRRSQVKVRCICKRAVYILKRALNIRKRALNIHKRALHISKRTLHIRERALNIRKEPYTSSISAKGRMIGHTIKDNIHLQKSSTYPQKRPEYPQKSPGYPQMSLEYLQKSPTHSPCPPKSPISYRMCPIFDQKSLFSIKRAHFL